jgi:hypothetical protein
VSSRAAIRPNLTSRRRYDVLSTHLSSTRGRVGGALVLVGALSGLVLAPSIGGAAPTTRTVSGRFTGTQVTGPSCTSPVNLCVHGTLSGGIKGTFDTTTSATSPGEPSGIVFLSSNSVIQTTSGSLFTTDSTAINTNPGGDGEFASLSEITDGTGSFGSTSGYFQLVGTFKNGVESGTYTGKLINP